MAAALRARCVAMVPHRLHAVPAMSMRAISSLSRASAASPAVSCIRPRDAVHRIPARGIGILDRMRSFVDRRSKASVDVARKNMFEKQLAALVAAPVYGMAQHVKTLEDAAAQMGADSWKSMLRTAEQTAEVNEQLLDVAIARCLTAEDREALDAVQPLRRHAKARICSGAGVNVERLNAFTAGFGQTRAIHAWIQSRVKAGLPLPATLEEYMLAMTHDRQASQAAASAAPAAKRPRSTRAMLRRAL